MDGSFPVLLVDIVGWSKRSSSWQVMLLEELHAAMREASGLHLTEKDSWGRLTKHGTGDGWYVFLEHGFNASSALGLFLNLGVEVDARNQRSPDLKLRVRTVLVYGPVAEVAGQFHAEINTIGARLLDGELLRSAVREWNLSCVLAVSDVFWNQLDQESQNLRWSRIEETDKHGGVHPGYLFAPEGCEPPVDFHRDILQKIEGDAAQAERGSEEA